MSTSTAVPNLSNAAWEALEGAYDLQVHVAPDVIGRRIDDIDLAKEFLAHKMRGFVLKSHYVPTHERSQVVTKAVPGIDARGAIVLNHSIGGLNPVAVEILSSLRVVILRRSIVMEPMFVSLTIVQLHRLPIALTRLLSKMAL